jgi:long-chain acyl-CoA synthetase
MRSPSDAETQPPQTFGAVIAEHARVRPEASAIIFEDRRTSYAELDRRTNRVANALLAAGVGPGRRIAYLGKNSDAALELTLGAAKAGAVMTPIGWRLAGEEIAWIADDCDAAMLFVEAEFADLVQGLAARLPKVRGYVATDNAVAGWASYAAWRDAAPDATPAVQTTPDDVVLQIYTSGTTGRPKGAMLTHANGIGFRTIVNRLGAEWIAGAAGEISLLVMPFAHIAGVGQSMGTFFNGGTVVVHREFDAGAVLDAVEQHGLTRLFLVPSALQIVLAHPKAATTDFSRLNYFFYGASPIPLELLRRAIEVLGCGFVQLYGMTETWGGIVALGPEDHDPAAPRRMTSAGRALPGVELRILGPDGEVLAPNTVGEVAVRGPSVMKGYWNRAKETAEALSADGWLRTGDAALMDEDGYLFIQDRIKDMIISGGENVYPAEVESAIYGCPGVADVAVIGVPDARWGEAVKAVVVSAPGATPDPAAVIAWARQRVAAFKAPKSVDFIDALPRNPSGKILRRQLREPYWAGRTRQVN